MGRKAQDHRKQPNGLQSLAEGNGNMWTGMPFGILLNTALTPDCSETALSTTYSMCSCSTFCCLSAPLPSFFTLAHTVTPLE